MSMLYTIPEEEDIRPATLEDEIDKLKKENLAYRHDPLWSLFFAMTRKTNEMAESLNSFSLDLMKDDKSFERYMSLQKSFKETVENIAWLRTEFLKIPEDQIQEQEKKGVPFIEQFAQRKKKNVRTETK